jgi:hypothetical protein
MLFDGIRRMADSHKTDPANRACHIRSYWIARILQCSGVGTVETAWIFSSFSHGQMTDNIRAVVRIVDPITDESYDKDGNPYRIDRSVSSFNLHAAPVIRTSSGRELVFDTYFYDSPPTLEQWRDDFQALEAGTRLGFRRASSACLSFADTLDVLPVDGSLSRKWYDFKRILQVRYDLFLLEPRPLAEPFRAKWLGEDRAPYDCAGKTARKNADFVASSVSA